MSEANALIIFSLAFFRSGASNQPRQSYAWNHDADKGGPYYCGDGVDWLQGIGKFK